MTYPNESISEDLKLVEKELGIHLDSALLFKYQCGVYPHLLAYEKIDDSFSQIPVLQKYLIGVASSFIQPATYYDLFRACRSVNMIRVLARSLRSNVRALENWERKKQALINSIKFDDFDSTLFEVATASAYLLHPETKNVLFTKDVSTTIPDLIVSTTAREIFVECKKFNRQTDFSIQLRDDVRACLDRVIIGTAKLGLPNLGEIIFKQEPNLIPHEQLLKDYLTAISTGKEFDRDGYEISGTLLPPSSNSDYKLFSSPKYFSERYAFDEKKWIGIVALFKGRPCVCEGFNDENAQSFSWVDEVQWESAIKWTIDDDQIEWRLKKMNYDSVFKSIRQINPNPFDSQVHLWIERDPAIGHRRKEIVNLINKVGESKIPFGWLIFNETISRVTLDGRFDFWEHAHPIGNKSGPPKPFLKSIFTTDEDAISDSGVFGIGADE